jgi:hypothetical protein
LYISIYLFTFICPHNQHHHQAAMHALRSYINIKKQRNIFSETFTSHILAANKAKHKPPEDGRWDGSCCAGAKGQRRRRRAGGGG